MTIRIFSTPQDRVEPTKVLVNGKPWLLFTTFRTKAAALKDAKVKDTRFPTRRVIAITKLAPPLVRKGESWGVIARRK